MERGEGVEEGLGLGVGPKGPVGAAKGIPVHTSTISSRTPGGQRGRGVRRDRAGLPGPLGQATSRFSNRRNAKSKAAPLYITQ